MIKRSFSFAHIARFIQQADNLPNAVFHIQRDQNGHWYLECDMWTHAHENPNAPNTLAERWIKESSPSGISAQELWAQFINYDAKNYDDEAQKVWDETSEPPFASSDVEGGGG